MKKLIYLLLLLLIVATPCFGQDMARMSLGVIGGGVPAAGCADTSCTGFLICQNFEGTGYDNSETWTENVTGTAVVDEDDTTATILRGSQQLKITAGDGTGSARTAFTASGTVYGHVKFKTGDATPTATVYIITLYDSTYGNNLSIRILTGGQLGLTDESHPGNTVGVLSDNTAYHIWFSYTKGAGTDAKYTLAFSATTTEPTSGNNYCEVTVGHGTLNMSILWLMSASALVNDFDQILLKTTTIGTVCN